MKQRDLEAAQKELAESIFAQHGVDLAMAVRVARAIEALIKLYAGHDEPKRREPDGGDGE